jgi:prepilin-type N-terminal cleavage/methylation domain-containing protein/prepilin-type processing-associated H-X9-DG protein
MEKMQVNDCRRGFTLIELLVVIAIIAILAAILFPVFAQARDKARQTQCLSNAKQLGTAIMMYAQDYDEVLPYHTYNYTNFPEPSVNKNNVTKWPVVVQPYLKNTQVLHCPSMSIRSGYRYQDSVYNWSVYVPWAYNGDPKRGLSYATPLAAIPYPAEMAFLTESQLPGYTDLGTHVFYDVSGTGDGPDRLAGRHQDGLILVYCDGHAKCARRDWALDQMRNIDRSRTFNKLAP